MLNLSKYFEKFKLIDKNFGSKVADVANTIEETTGVHLEPSSLQIKDGKALISASPALRNEILMSKSRIIEILRSKNINLEIK